MKVLITGATGLVGQELVKHCHESGLTVHYLSSSKSKLANHFNYKGFYWDIKSGEIDVACFEGVTAVIHLVGATISKRWTKSYKKEVLDSRLKSTQLLKECIVKHHFPIEHFISASAIGIYPSSQTHFYDESETHMAKTFLGDVVQQWEAAVDQLAFKDCKVSKIRIGLVLSNDGGALPKIIQPIQYGLGAVFGSGEQWQSWIHITDLAAIFLFVLEQELEGVFNAVAPNPVTNTQLTKAAARILRRPLILPNVPRAVMQVILGEMSMLLFESQRVNAQKIQGEGFQFQFPNLKPALEDLLV